MGIPEITTIYLAFSASNLHTIIPFSDVLLSRAKNNCEIDTKKLLDQIGLISILCPFALKMLIPSYNNGNIITQIIHYFDVIMEV